MKTILRYAAAIPATLCLLVFTGCEQANDTSYDDTSWESGDDYSWQDPDGTGPQEEVIADTHYTVVDKRISGGEMVEDPSDISQLDGKPRKKRTPQRFVIITRGNNTGQEAAYELPSSDFNVVQIGHNLQESTLNRWEKVTGDNIPPATETSSRQGGERPYQVMDSGHIAY